LVYVDHDVVNVDQDAVNVDQDVINVDHDVVNVDQDVINVDQGAVNVDQGVVARRSRSVPGVRTSSPLKMPPERKPRVGGDSLKPEMPVESCPDLLEALRRKVPETLGEALPGEGPDLLAERLRGGAGLGGALPRSLPGSAPLLRGGAPNGAAFEAGA
jgi:hypothetical protein